MVDSLLQSIHMRPPAPLDSLWQLYAFRTTTRRQSIFRYAFPSHSHQKLDFHIADRCCKADCISPIGSLWHIDDQEFLELREL
jgi:hypothetical protein